jgi:hypothetical protein
VVSCCKLLASCACCVNNIVERSIIADRLVQELKGGVCHHRRAADGAADGQRF